MFLEKIKESYNDDILNAMDRLISKSEFSFECLGNINSDLQLEVLKAARDVYNRKDTIRMCSICHHSELIRDDWMSGSLCLDCGRIRNNRGKVKELLESFTRK